MINNKKKVLFITDYYLPHWTGLSKSLNLIVAALDKKNNCSVLTIAHQKNLDKQEIIDDHSVYRVGFWWTISRAKFAPAILLKYLQLLDKHDYVVINSPFTFILPLTILAKLFTKRVYIFHQGDLILPVGFFNKIIEGIFNISSLMAFVLADGLATYTKDYAQHSRLLKYFRGKTSNFIIPFPMTKKTNKKLKKIIDLRRKYSTIIGLSGRFVEEKGFDNLFKAIPLINQKNSDLHFVFAGEKNMGYEDFFHQHQQLYKQVKQQISFLGLLAGEELESFYHSLDALVMPSRSDCFGLVQAEAMRYEKPVIVTNIIGGRDVVKQTKFGEIAEANNVTDLAEKILLFAKQKESYQRFLPAVKNYFSFKKNLADLEHWLA